LKTSKTLKAHQKRLHGVINLSFEECVVKQNLHHNEKQNIVHVEKKIFRQSNIKEYFVVIK
jgi:hypothetical protein